MPCGKVVMDPNIARKLRKHQKKAFDGCIGRSSGLMMKSERLAAGIVIVYQYYREL